MTRTQRWTIAAAALGGAAGGLGFYTFGVARGYAYLTNDPAACANCHVMNEHYAAWMKASHHAVATCNDCHAPHDVVGKYLVKARNGFWHSFYFTTGGYPYPLRITEPNRAVTERACRYCHAEMTEAIDNVSTGRSQTSLSVATPDTLTTRHSNAGAEPASCVRCHRYVGHWVR